MRRGREPTTTQPPRYAYNVNVDAKTHRARQTVARTDVAVCE
jgi:hypothetical protein